MRRLFSSVLFTCLCTTLIFALTSCGQNQTQNGSIQIILGENDFRSVTSTTKNEIPDTPSEYRYSLSAFAQGEEKPDMEMHPWHFYDQGTFSGRSGDSIDLLIPEVPVEIVVKIDFSLESGNSRYKYSSDPFLVEPGMNFVTLKKQSSTEPSPKPGDDPTDDPTDDPDSGKTEEEEDQGISGANGTSYKKLKDAFSDACTRGGNVTLTLSKDITVIGALDMENASGSKITIDLNGNILYWVPKIPIIGTDQSLLSVTPGNTVAIVSSTEKKGAIILTSVSEASVPLFITENSTAATSTLALKNLIITGLRYNRDDAAVLLAEEGSVVHMENVTVTLNSASKEGNLGMIAAKNAALYMKECNINKNTGYTTNGIYLDNSQFAFAGGIISSDTDSFSNANTADRASALYITNTNEEASPTDKVGISNTTLSSAITSIPVVAVENSSHLNMANGLIIADFDYDTLTTKTYANEDGSPNYRNTWEILGYEKEKDTRVYAGTSFSEINLNAHVMRLGRDASGAKSSLAYIGMADQSAVLGVIDLNLGSQIMLTGKNTYSVTTATGATYNQIASVNFVDGLDAFIYDPNDEEKTNIYSLRPIFFKKDFAEQSDPQIPLESEYAARFFIQNSSDDTDAADYTYGFAKLDSSDDNMIILCPVRQEKAQGSDPNQNQSGD